MNLGIIVGGYVAAAVFFGLWLSARDAVIEEREGCNADKLSAALAAERAVADRQRKALESRIEQLASEAERSREAARIAEARRQEAEARPERVRTVVREVPREELEGKCLDIPVPAGVLDSLRD